MKISKLSVGDIVELSIVGKRVRGQVICITGPNACTILLDGGTQYNADETDTISRVASAPEGTSS